MLYSRHLHDSGLSTQAVRAWFRASRCVIKGPCAPNFQVFSLVVEVKLVQQTLSLVELSREELWELWSYGDRRGAAADRLLPPGPIPGHGLHAFSTDSTIASHLRELPSPGRNLFPDSPVLGRTMEHPKVPRMRNFASCESSACRMVTCVSGACAACGAVTK